METKVNVQGGTIQLPDGTTGYFKSEYVESCSDIKYSDKGVAKYDIKLDKTDGRCLVFHNNDLNKDFIVPLSDQIEKYEKTYIAQIVNPLVIENNSCTIIITFSVNSESKLTKYEPSKLYKMTKEQSKNCLSAANQVTVFSALLKIEKLDENIIPICVAIKLQSETLDSFVNDIGGGGGIPPVVLATVQGGKVTSLTDIQTGEPIETKIPTIFPSLSSVSQQGISKSNFTTIVYRGKVQTMMKFEKQ